jgi:SAM-dependent methyltransferase
VLIPLIKKGLKVVGIDNSEEMLKICQTKLSELPKRLSSNVELIYGDMKNFSLERKFKFIFVSFNSFLLLTSKKDQESCLKCVYNHLDDNGIFMVTAANKSEILKRHRNTPLNTVCIKNNLYEIELLKDYQTGTSSLTFFVEIISKSDTELGEGTKPSVHLCMFRIRQSVDLMQSSH